MSSTAATLGNGAGEPRQRGVLFLAFESLLQTGGATRCTRIPPLDLGKGCQPHAIFLAASLRWEMVGGGSCTLSQRPLFSPLGFSSLSQQKGSSSRTKMESSPQINRTPLFPPASLPFPRLLGFPRIGRLLPASLRLKSWQQTGLGARGWYPAAAFSPKWSCNLFPTSPQLECWGNRLPGGWRNLGVSLLAVVAEAQPAQRAVSRELLF